VRNYVGDADVVCCHSASGGCVGYAGIRVVVCGEGVAGGGSVICGVDIYEMFCGVGMLS